MILPGAIEGRIQVTRSPLQYPTTSGPALFDRLVNPWPGRHPDLRRARVERTGIFLLRCVAVKKLHIVAPGIQAENPHLQPGGPSNCPHAFDTYS